MVDRRRSSCGKTMFDEMQLEDCKNVFCKICSGVWFWRRLPEMFSKRSVEHRTLQGREAWNRQKHRKTVLKAVVRRSRAKPCDSASVVWVSDNRCARGPAVVSCFRVCLSCSRLRRVSSKQAFQDVSFPLRYRRFFFKPKWCTQCMNNDNYNNKSSIFIIIGMAFLWTRLF